MVVDRRMIIMSKSGSYNYLPFFSSDILAGQIFHVCFEYLAVSTALDLGMLL